MADSASWKGGRLGAFHLGRRYKDIGAGLGRVYEAHDVHTGASAVVVMPGQGADWEPTEVWQIRVSSHVEPSHVALAVEHAPSTGRVPELSAMLDLLTSAVERLEKKDEVRAHLTHGPIGPWRRWTGRVRRLLLSRWLLVATGLTMVALAVAFWWHPPAFQRDDQMTLAGDGTAHTTPPEMGLVNGGGFVPDAVAFPMPDKPYSNQAKPPCRPRRGEVEINGGCWVELSKRPPCEDTVEYKGKCYAVVGERSPRPSQSIQE
ncbi:hypothetical protein BO221_47210 [Archangium sp. Cb G35]|uniref:hypothetical protein n=1 Tax=Archangium sp. Cb G35 TaxID=1920190 RepID=UPI0009371C57|nr:hypothetical protein [Archangium sp. Cb G35]OJT17015.1 hypothetical protein BO221_47210 [Archangium sp. Cb G35]